MTVLFKKWQYICNNWLVDGDIPPKNERRYTAWHAQSACCDVYHPFLGGCTSIHQTFLLLFLNI